MKSETKEIIAEIKRVMKEFLDDCYYIKAINFLDSLSGLEEQLKHGGLLFLTETTSRAKTAIK